MSLRSNRRHFLRATTTALSLSGLAGCTTSTTTSSSVDCQTAALRHGDADVIQEANVVPDGDALRLRIALNSGAIDGDAVDRLVVSEGMGDGFVIPTTDQRVYEQYLGRRPLHGRLKIVALGEYEAVSNPVGSVGPTLDSLTIDFHCSSEESG